MAQNYRLWNYEVRQLKGRKGENNNILIKAANEDPQLRRELGEEGLTPKGTPGINKDYASYAELKEVTRQILGPSVESLPFNQEHIDAWKLRKDHIFPTMYQVMIAYLEEYLKTNGISVDGKGYDIHKHYMFPLYIEAFGEPKGYIYIPSDTARKFMSTINSDKEQYGFYLRPEPIVSFLAKIKTLQEIFDAEGKEGLLNKFKKEIPKAGVLYRHISEVGAYYPIIYQTLNCGYWSDVFMVWAFIYSILKRTLDESDNFLLLTSEIRVETGKDIKGNTHSVGCCKVIYMDVLGHFEYGWIKTASIDDYACESLLKRNILTKIFPLFENVEKDKAEQAITSKYAMKGLSTVVNSALVQYYNNMIEESCEVYADRIEKFTEESKSRTMIGQKLKEQPSLGVAMQKIIPEKIGGKTIRITSAIVPDTGKMLRERVEETKKRRNQQQKVKTITMGPKSKTVIMRDKDPKKK